MAGESAASTAGMKGILKVAMMVDQKEYGWVGSMAIEMAGRTVGTKVFETAA
jgi:hypothetical protein